VFSAIHFFFQLETMTKYGLKNANPQWRELYDEVQKKLEISMPKRKKIQTLLSTSNIISRN
jgi:hypothetical protein